MVENAITSKNPQLTAINGRFASAVIKQIVPARIIVCLAYFAVASRVITGENGGTGVIIKRKLSGMWNPPKKV